MTQILGLAAAVAMFTAFSALHPRRSMGCETYLLALLASLLDVAIGSRGDRRAACEAGDRPAPAKKTAPTKVVENRVVLCAGLLATGSGALPMVYGVLPKTFFLVAASALSIGVRLGSAPRKDVRGSRKVAGLGRHIA